MAIPKRVQQQADEAERLAKEHFNPKTPETDEAPPAAKTAPTETTPSSSDQTEDWEKRFKGLKKTYDKTVYEMRNEIKDLKATIEKLERAPAAQPAAQSSPASSGNVSSEDIMSVLTPQERDEYSPEFLNMVARLASRVAGNPGGSRPDDIVTRIDRIEQNQVKSAEDKFWDAINKAVPNWKELQATEDMQGWLLEHDDMLGMSRNDAIAEAQSNLDSARVIAIFNQYKKPARPKITDTEEGELIAPPPGGGDGGVPPSADQKMWKLSEINKFYTDLALKKYKGAEGAKRAAAIEKSIEKARDEGRIVQG